jgi:hypothetical protein
MLEAGVSCRVTDSLGSTVTAHATISFERS